MTGIRILADDLTGALDAAAPFATPEEPVHLSVDPSRALGGAKRTASSESRDSPLPIALDAVRDSSARLLTGTDERTLWFKKVDSVLRGWPVEETLELMRLLGLPLCLFAPAFPEMGRRTIGGFHQTADQERPGLWEPAAIHDLLGAFQAAGARARLLGRDVAAAGILIGDAEEAADLRALVGQVPKDGVLWAGSRGLAEALCPPRRPIPCPRIGTIVVGTSHPVSRRQVQSLLQAGLADLSLIDPVPASRDAEETADQLRQAIRSLEHPGSRALIVVGGNTLATVLAAAEADALACLGEIAPGLPLSRIVGGRIAGVELVTKSGGFGAADLFMQLSPHWSYR